MRLKGSPDFPPFSGDGRYWNPYPEWLFGFQQAIIKVTKEINVEGEKELIPLQRRGLMLTEPNCNALIRRFYVCVGIIARCRKISKKFSMPD